MKYETKATLRQYAAAIIANVAAFCIGNMLGWSSPVQPILESENSPIGEPLTRPQFSWLSSINFLGGVAGTLFWGRLSDKLGRKWTGLLVAVPFAVGWALILAANNQWILYIGRVFIGIGCSGTVINTPVFVTEIAQDKIRGALGSLLMINLNLGTLFSFIVGASTSYYFLTATCLGVVLLYFLGLLFMPDSPGSLLVKKKRAEALKSMCWYRGGDQVQAEKDLTLVETRLTKPRRSYASIFESKGRTKGFIIGVGFIIGQQACGMLAVTTYAVTIFKEAVAYSIGAGPVPFIVLSELFAPDIRGTAISLIQFIGIGLSFVTVKIFPWMNSQLGPTITFGSFGLASLLLPIFIIFVVARNERSNTQFHRARVGRRKAR
ncbi:hypothetical protein GE061_013704 [Apolygus lucorum]|uniref:Major facilitator superfamily (MFS) profile domain-containing protein n=1 Tax=Apolygus lucorum TaxID=248454 RepID=A0A8S9XQS8_APOLU|nr:hypothetical protein GE061_013704 [Apolygus lucorum]